MPTQSWTVTAPNGKQFDLTGDHVPSESELNDLFKAAGADTAAPKLPTADDLAAAKTPADRLAILKQTPVGGDLQSVLQLAHTWATKGPHAVVEGLKSLVGGDYAKGAHEVITGAGITALPMVAGPLASAAVSAPATTALMLGGGYAGSKLAEGGARAAGATEDQAALAGDVGGIVGGVGGAAASSIPRPSVAGVARALDNPVVGAVSPRLRNVAELANRIADAVRSTGATPAETEAAVSVAAPHLDLSQRIQAGELTPAQIGERLAAARASGVRVPMPERIRTGPPPVRVPLPEQPAAPPAPPPAPAAPPPVMRTGTSMQPAPMPVPRPPAPVETPPVAAVPVEAPAPTAAPAATVSPQRAMNDLAIAARRAKTTLSADDYDALKPIVQAGTPAADAVAALVKTRVESAPADPAAAFAARFGLPSDAERTFPPNKSGLPFKAPRADAKAQREGAVSSIPDRWLQGRTRALEQQGLSPRDAIQQAAQDWREQATASSNQYADIPAELVKPAAEKGADFFAAEEQATKAHRATVNKEISKLTHGAVLESPQGDRILIHESTNESGRWQATFLNAKGEVTGHTTFSSLADAYKSARGVFGSEPPIGGRTYKLVKKGY